MASTTCWPARMAAQREEIKEYRERPER